MRIRSFSLHLIVNGIDWLCFQNGWKLFTSSVLKRIKYIVKEVTRHVNDELGIFSNDSDESDG